MSSSETVPAFSGNVGFNAHHSPMGAFFSFTCGHVGTRGGLGAQLGKPANQDLYIGVKKGDRKSNSPLVCLPFYEGANDDAAAAFLVEQSRTSDPAHQRSLVSYPKDQIQRYYGWGSDRWVTPDFQFTIYTPFGPIPDPATSNALDLQRALLPAVVAELTVDNTQGTETRTALFAIGFSDSGVRLLDQGAGDAAVGFALRGQLGVLGELEESDNDDGQPFPILRWSPTMALQDANPIHLLGSVPGIALEVKPGQKRTLRLALGCYLDGVVTTRIEGKYFYTRYYSNLTHVLAEALASFDLLKEQALARDAELLASSLSPEQQFLIAHATRSYYGATQLLDVGGQPFWVVNEGEYCMMNTLDLSVDHVFWELKYNPWVVRNLLDNFARHYSYQDQVKEPKTGKLLPGGVSFCHDMGVHNQFSPFGHSSYELANLNALCFSHMTGEQLCNWLLMAACYVAATGDAQWAVANESLITACLRSLVNRGGETGFFQYDSSRCGQSGAEITTYDSLDHSLAQTRNNVYMAVKAWAAYLAVARLYEATGNRDTEKPLRQAARVAQAVVAQVQADGSLPAVFERDSSGSASRILPAIEGLVYPLFWQSNDALQPDGAFGAMVQALRRHTAVLLSDAERRNLFADGGIKLSSTSNNSWISKIAIFQHVVRRVFRLDEDTKIAQIFHQADAAHVKWETEGASAYWAMSDQIVSGVAQGSKYYPRCVTTVLWL